jgi:hypothetical protein
MPATGAAIAKPASAAANRYHGQPLQLTAVASYIVDRRIKLAANYIKRIEIGDTADLLQS